MRYGIDLDNVCFDFRDVFRKYLNNVLDIDLLEEELTCYLWYEGTDKISEDEFWEEFHKFGNAGKYKELPLLPGTLDALDKITQAGHEIFYITNRPEYTRQDTIDALREHNFPFRKNLFYALGDKGSLVNKLNISIFVEDSSKAITDIVNNTSAVVYCVDYPANRKLDEHNKIKRIYDWDDFLLAEAI